jgi:predicted nucleic acid-binding protein
MALICDTSGIYALYDTSDAQHAPVTAVVESEPGELLLPVVLLAEIDYLIHLRLGADAALEFLEAVEQAVLARRLPKS